MNTTTQPLHLICVLNGRQSSLFYPKLTFFGSNAITSLSGPAPEYPIFIADGGLNSFPEDINFDGDNLFFFGDCDSADKSKAARFPENKKHIFDPNKDASDFGLILDHIGGMLSKTKLSTSGVIIDIIAGLGQDPAHEIVNILEAWRFLSHIAEPGCIIFHPNIAITSGKISLSLNVGKEFSIVAFSKSTIRVIIKGAKYNGTIDIKRPSHGLHNVVTEETLTIEPEGQPVCVLI